MQLQGEGFFVFCLFFLVHRLVTCHPLFPWWLVPCFGKTTSVSLKGKMAASVQCTVYSYFLSVPQSLLLDTLLDDSEEIGMIEMNEYIRNQ